MSISSAPDPVATVLGAVAIGSAAGGALGCAGLLAFYGLRAANDPRYAELVLASGTAGLATAAFIALAITRALGKLRGLVAGMTAVAGAGLVIVLTALVDRLAGRVGLLLLIGLCLVAIAGAWLLFLRPAAPQASSS